MQAKASMYNVEVCVPGYSESVIFNTLTGNIVVLDAATASVLRKGTFAEMGSEDVAKLAEASLVVDADLNESAYFRYSLANSKYSCAALGMFLCFTSQCNFRCAYCFEDSRTGRPQARLTPDKFQAVLRFIRQQREEHMTSSIDIVLFGGEPLLNFSMVHEATVSLKALEDEGMSVAIILITNGSLLTEEVCGMLGPHLDLVQIALDGPRDVHNERRSYAHGGGTYDDVMAGIKRAIRFFKSILIYPVVDSSNVGAMEDLLQQLAIVDPLKKLAIGFSPCVPSQQTISSGCISGCSSPFDPALLWKIRDLYILAAEMGFPVAKDAIRGPCVNCFRNRFALDEDLNVYKCPARLYEPYPDGIIDKNGALHVLRSNWYETIAFEPPCVGKCPYGPICYGGCRWMAGGPTKMTCSKQWFQEVLQGQLGAYVVSHYRHKLSTKGSIA